MNKKSSFKLLVVDDEPEMCNSLKKILEKKGYRVSVASSGKTALELLQTESFDLILCDIVMPEMGGLVFLSRIQKDIPVIMMTAYASIETARKAFRWGVRDYLVKPFRLEELFLVIEENLNRSQPAVEGDPQVFLQSKNKAYQKVLELASKFAQTDLPILLVGESGVGKEVIADYIRSLSLRKEKPYIKINCAAIPETLLETELFGYERGAFTGAFSRKIGKVEEADEGTLFLDEIGDIPLNLQAKLLRFLENYEFSRVGGKTYTLNVRVISATNQNLEEHIKKGEFREDLYYRLNGVQIQVPPLRERIEDIEDLSFFFLTKLQVKYNKNVTNIHPDVFQLFRHYRWPGNIRELRNCLERAFISCDQETIQPEHLPDIILSAGTSSNLDSLTFQIQQSQSAYLRELILKTLRTTQGNQKEAAKVLRISRKTLYNWMKKLQIQYEYK